MRGDDPLFRGILREKLRDNFSMVVQSGQELDLDFRQWQDGTQQVSALLDELQRPRRKLRPPRRKTATKRGHELPVDFLRLDPTPSKESVRQSSRLLPPYTTKPSRSRRLLRPSLRSSSRASKRSRLA